MTDGKTALHLWENYDFFFLDDIIQQLGEYERLKQGKPTEAEEQDTETLLAKAREFTRDKAQEIKVPVGSKEVSLNQLMTFDF